MTIKISPHRHKRPRPIIFGVVLLAAILLGSFFVPLPGVLGRAAHFVAVPFLKIEAGFGTFAAPVSTFFETKKTLEAQIAQLQAENGALRHDGLLGEYLEYENQQMKIALGRDEGSAAVGELAAVLAGPGRSPYDTFVIDAGRDRGVADGSIITAMSGDVLGIVTHVYDKSAVVTLFSSPDMATKVTIGTSSPHQVKAEGRGGGSFEIQLPREATVAVGEPIVLPGMPLYLLGAVERIEADPTSAYQSILFTYPVNIFETRYVIIHNPLPASVAWDNDDGADVPPGE